MENRKIRGNQRMNDPRLFALREGVIMGTACRQAVNMDLSNATAWLLVCDLLTIPSALPLRQLVCDVVLIDVPDIGHGDLTDLSCHNELNIAEPLVGI